VDASRHSRVLIIGSGPAGYTAAVYAARAALEPVLVQGIQPGGQLTITTDVENWPGETAIMGPDLMIKMAAQAEHVGTTLISDVITSVDLSRAPFIAIGDSGTEYSGDTMIIATGAQARWLGLPSETRYRGFGVSACATCDGFFYRGKTVAVVGGGNTAVEEALFLTNFASRVYLIHRRDTLRADRTNQARLASNPKIEMIWNAEVAEVHGTDAPPGVTAVSLRDPRGGIGRTLDVDGLFIAIGHHPATELFQGQVEMDEEGYIITAPDSTATSVPGVFAAGDVKDKIFRQAVTAAGMGCMAALEAERYLAHHSLTGIASAEAAE
jgi:thioredoxin reductase (NADPH)